MHALDFLGEETCNDVPEGEGLTFSPKHVALCYRFHLVYEHNDNILLYISRSIVSLSCQSMNGPSVEYFVLLGIREAHKSWGCAL